MTTDIPTSINCKKIKQKYAGYELYLVMLMSFVCKVQDELIDELMQAEPSCQS